MSCYDERDSIRNQQNIFSVEYYLNLLFLI